MKQTTDIEFFLDKTEKKILMITVDSINSGSENSGRVSDK